MNKEPLVRDRQWGVAFVWREVRVSYTHVVRTREFRAQQKRDDFRAFTISIPF